MTFAFNENGVQTDTFEEIFEALDAGYREIYGQDIITDQESPDGQRIGIETTLRYDLESFAAWLYSQIDPDLNTGDMQQIIAKLAGVYLLAASRSQWDLEVEVSRNITLPSGYTVADQNGVEWFLDSDVSVLSGSNSVTFLAVEWGSVSGVASGSEFTQSTPENYVTSISAGADAVKGREEETVEEFRLRRKMSTENPSQSTNGAIYAKLAALPGVTDLQVYDNPDSTYDVERDIPAHFMWVVIDGGSLDDIGEVMAKQRLGGTKGDITTTYTDTLTKPNGDPFYLVNEQKIDRSTTVNLYVRLTATQKTVTSNIDVDAIKEKLAAIKFYIGQAQQAGELYDYAYIDNFNYIVSDLEISLDGVTWTAKSEFPGYDGKFLIDTANVTITEAAP